MPEQVVSALWALVAAILGLLVALIAREIVQGRKENGNGPSSKILLDTMHRIADATEAMRDNLKEINTERQRDVERLEERYPFRDHQRMTQQVAAIHEKVVERPRGR